MDLLKKLNEDAAGGAVGAGAIAGFSYPMFSKASAIKRQLPSAHQPSKKKKKGINLKESFVKRLSEDLSPDFDQTEVLGKLKSLEKKDKVDRHDVVTFGLEDKDGNIVRVSVEGSQADEFQNALQSFLADEEENDDGAAEIAEILFELRDRFNIIDVIWPEVEEDQEEGQQVAPEQGGEQPVDPNADPNAPIDPNADPNAVGGDMTPPDTADPQSLLTQVIDMMRTDAEARKAEAIARQKEAEARSQEAQNRTAKARVKQEEELLDMEAHFKEKKELNKESKQLAKLAQWKREVDQDSPTGPGTVDKDIDFGPTGSKEEEEYGKKLSNLRSRVPAAHLAQFILKRVK